MTLFLIFQCICSFSSFHDSIFKTMNSRKWNRLRKKSIDFSKSLIMIEYNCVDDSRVSATAFSNKLSFGRFFRKKVDFCLGMRSFGLDQCTRDASIQHLCILTPTTQYISQQEDTNTAMEKRLWSYKGCYKCHTHSHMSITAVTVQCMLRPHNNASIRCIAFDLCSTKT